MTGPRITPAYGLPVAAWLAQAAVVLGVVVPHDAAGWEIALLPGVVAMAPLAPDGALIAIPVVGRLAAPARGAA